MKEGVRMQLLTIRKCVCSHGYRGGNREHSQESWASGVEAHASEGNKGFVSGNVSLPTGYRKSFCYVLLPLVSMC